MQVNPCIPIPPELYLAVVRAGKSCTCFHEIRIVTATFIWIIQQRLEDFILAKCLIPGDILYRPVLIPLLNFHFEIDLEFYFSFCGELGHKYSNARPLRQKSTKPNPLICIMYQKWFWSRNVSHKIRL